jgi:hypothetical protein
VLRAVRERLGLSDVRGVDRSVLWTVDLDTADPDAVRRASETVTGTERGAGILVNRHAQDAELRVVKAEA